ncbi:DUF3489 domain-containing protein [Parablastomonas sp. CN1-191]|uniref:DUF3489 domain-containing protein n=1 Tax=Parablastomonas sp. CN1-191 TaxID=3400908 RepID=UPI003BF800CD
MTLPAPTNRKPRRMAREIDTSSGLASPAPKAQSRLDRLASLLTRDQGASIAEMTAATGWQAHSVRGALAGALKKRGLIITSDKSGGERRYKAAAA